MHIGMRLLHPAAADHSVSISRQQVQRIFSFSLRSRAVLIVLLQTYPKAVPSSLWCWCTAIQRWWSPFVEWVAHIRQHYPLLCCSGHLPCALQHAKRAKPSLKELHGWNVFLKTRLFKDALPPVRFWMRSLPGAGWWSRSLPLVSGHWARWGGFCGWVMPPLRGVTFAGPGGKRRSKQPWDGRPRDGMIALREMVNAPLPPRRRAGWRILCFFFFRFGPGNETPEPGPCVPPRCPTAGTSVGSLVPLVWFLGAWLALPNPSRWLLHTIRLGYAIQFARQPPKYRGVHFTSGKEADAPILRAEIAVLLAKDAIEPVPPADMRSGFYSPYFIVPKKGGGLRPILDLRVLNRALHRLMFKMLTPKRIFGCVRPQDWFVAIDLKDAYFHVSILPRHRSFLWFAFEGRAYQYKVLPFGLSLSSHVFTKVAEAALVPLREQGVRILNYLDDWLILAQSRDQLCEHRDLVLSHLSQLGLQVNWEKSKLSPVQRISFLGMELDSASQTARLTQEHAQSVLNCLNTFKNRTAAPLKQFQRLLGHMAAVAAVTPLGLLHMRPLQHWLHGRVPRWAWQSGTPRVQVTPACRQTFTPWSDLSFLRAGVPLEQVSRHAVVYTDASAKGWGATFNGHAVSGVWTGPQLHWHINCLELLAVHLALNRLKRRLRGEHVLVRTDSTATVAYINRQGGLRSRHMSQLARHLLLWSRKHLRSLRAIHIPGLLNRTADELSRAALPREWRLHPQTVQLIWRRFGLA